MNRLMKIAVVVLAATTTVAIATVQNTGHVGSLPPGQAQPGKALSDNYHIAVQTNKDVYHDRDVLQLQITLVNNDSQAVLIATGQEPPVDTNIVAEVAAGALNTAVVDVAVLPNRPAVIGYATLTRLGPSPVPEPVPGVEEANVPQPGPQRFVLPLFGRRIIPPHSTRIISAANILISCPPPPESNGVAAATDAGPAPVEIIPAVGHFVAPAPGYYLLNCMVNKLAGTDVAQAQEIIQIIPAPPQPPVPR